MGSEKPPREFDIDLSSKDEHGVYAASIHTAEDLYWENCHAIEYSAFEALQKENERLSKNFISKTEYDAQDRFIDDFIKENVVLKSDYGTCSAERDTLKAENETYTECVKGFVKAVDGMDRENASLKQRLRDAFEALNWKKELSGLDRPADFAESEAKGNAICRALRLLDNNAGKYEGR